MPKKNHKPEEIVAKLQIGQCCEINIHLINTLVGTKNFL